MDIIKECDITKYWLNNNIVVSVVCTAYNHEKYIKDALNGFLIQKTNFPFEVLVNDDASTDNTAKILKEYQEKYPNIIKPIYHEVNEYSQGIDIFGNVVKLAKGKYIAICEGDDYWIDENKLQMQVDFLENNSEYTMCFHSAKILNELKIKNDSCQYNKINTKDYSATELFQNWIVPTASILIRKEILNNELKEREKFIYGDIIVVESAAHNGKVRGFENVSSVYRIQGNGVTWDIRREGLRFKKLPNHFKAIKKNFYLIDKAIINDKIVESYLLCVLKCGNVFNKLIWFISALFTSPLAFIRNTVKYLKRKI